MSTLPESRTDTPDAVRPALFRWYPELTGSLPWLPVGRFPTPVEPLRLAGSENVWVKRDDLSGEPYGGNKVRKLEWILAEARSQGAKRLITVGAFGSHHALATTVYGRAQGFDVSLVLFPQHVNPHVRDVLLLDHALGAELRFTRRMEFVPAALLAARFAHRRERCYMVPPGGSNEAGTLGYVSAGLELAEQIEAGEVPRPDVVHVATGTMGTAVGLAIGFALADLPIHLSAIRITSRIVTNERTLRRLLVRTLRRLERAGAAVPAPEAVLARVRFRHDFLGAGYGQETEAGARATELLAHTGLGLDPTYTAKAASAFLAALEEEPDRTHLFWHTLSACVPTDVGRDLDIHDLPPPFSSYLRAAG